jgi:hypothetical protein
MDLSGFELQAETCYWPRGLLSRGLLEEHATPSGALPRCRLKEGCLPDLRPK